MSLRIKGVVDKFVEELKEALDADIQDRIMKEREMQSYIEEREREVAERESAWKAELSRRQAEIARQEARLKMERENLEKEKSVLMGTASNQDNQDGALEITLKLCFWECVGPVATGEPPTTGEVSLLPGTEDVLTLFLCRERGFGMERKLFMMLRWRLGMVILRLYGHELVEF
ncbi:hypothetical protein Lal_00033808 [Lupinus albus]|nr:hypothetical protein Lal_00033808 [Lupinus albus]